MHREEKRISWQMRAEKGKGSSKRLINARLGVYRVFRVNAVA
jgi:hypothetical protein